MVYQYTPKNIRQNTQNYTQVYFIPEIQRKWYTEYPYLSCNIPYTRFKKPLYIVYPKTWPTLNLGKRNKWVCSTINSYPWPIFSNFVYFLLGSPTLTMVPEIKIHTFNINCCKDICHFQFLKETDREQIIDVRNLLWISSSDIFFFFLSLVCGFCCWSCEATETQKRIETLFWTQICSKISGYSNLKKPCKPVSSIDTPNNITFTSLSITKHGLPLSSSLAEGFMETSFGMYWNENKKILTYL